LYQTLQSVNRNIGNPAARTNDNLYWRLVDVSDAVGPQTGFAPTTILGRLKSVNDIIGTNGSSSQDTLFGYSQNVLGRTTGDIGRYVVGNDGNFFKQIKTLFTGNRYLINYFTVAELQTYNSSKASRDPELDKIIQAIETIVKNPKINLTPVSADELYKLISLTDPTINEKI
jgi:hypothetical protein